MVMEQHMCCSALDGLLGCPDLGDSQDFIRKAQVRSVSLLILQAGSGCRDGKHPIWQRYNALLTTCLFVRLIWIYLHCS